MTAPLPAKGLNGTCDETNTGLHPHQPLAQIATVSRELSQRHTHGNKQCTLTWYHKNNDYSEMADQTTER